MAESSAPRSPAPGGRRIARPVVVLVLLGVLAGCGPETPVAREAVRAAATTVTLTSLAPDVYRPCGISPAADVVWILACAGKAVGVRSRGMRLNRSIEGDIVGLDAMAGDGSGALWVMAAKGSGNARRGTIVTLEASSGESGPSIDLGASIPMHGASVGGTLWVATHDGGLFEVKDTEARRASTGPAIVWVVADGTTMWTVAENGDVVERGGDGAASRTFAAVLPRAHAAGAGLGSVWLASEDGLVRLDAEGTSSRVALAGTVNHIESCGGSVWLSQPDYGLRSLDASGKQVRSIPLEAAPSYLACDDGRLWILTEDGKLGSIDASG